MLEYLVNSYKTTNSLQWRDSPLITKIRQQQVQYFSFPATQKQ